MTTSYFIPAEAIETEYEIKKSRFIARLCYAPDRAEAMKALEQAKHDYPDARHHCWSYLLGSPNAPASAAMSDDGEPSGTAGKPMLNVMQHKPVGDAMLIVIRYFGGIKLGAGGLVRAYSHAAQQAYDALQTEAKVFLDTYTIECDFSEEQIIRHWLAQRDGRVDETHYGTKVMLTISLSASFENELERFLGGTKHALRVTND